MDVFTLLGKLTIDGISTAESQLSGLQDKLQSAGQTMTNFGKKASMYVTAPLTALGLTSYKLAGDFDTAFRSVNVMLQASAEEAEKYKEQILEISDTTGKSATDVTDAFYQIVSAGYRGADAIDILRVAMKGAVGGAADAIATTEALTKAMNIFQLEGAEGSARAMDVFFGIVDTGLLTFEELANAFPRAASNAAGLGISIEETGATLGTLTKVLGTTEQAATATDAIFRVLISPSEALNDLYKEWGVSSGPEAIAQFGGLTGVLEKLQVATGGEVTAIRELFNSDEAMKGILPLLTSSYEDYNAAVVTTTESEGKAAAAMEEMAQGPGFQWEQMLTKIKNAGISLGDSISTTLGPMFDKVIDWIKKIVEWFGNLSPGMQKAIIIVGLLAAGLGPLLLIIGQMSLGISALIGILPALGTAFTMATGPIGLIVAAIAAVIAIGVAVWKNWDTIKAMAKAVWEKIKQIFWAVVDWMKEWGILFLGPIGAIIKYWDEISGWFSDAWEKVKDVFWMVVDWMKEWGVLFLGPIGLVIKYWDEITDFFSDIWDEIKEIFSAPVEWIKDLWDDVVNFFKSIPEKIGKAFETVKDWLLAPFRAAVSGIENAINWIIRMINKISFDVPDWVPLIGGKHFGFDISEVKLPKFGKGGVIPEETLLYGLESKRPYAIAGEEGPEVVSPAGALPAITNNISGPFYVRDENDIQRLGEEVAKKLFRMVEQKYRARGISTA